MIKTGSKITIKKNLICILEVLNYNKDVINYLLKNNKNKVYSVKSTFYLNGQHYAVIDKGYYIPVECCKEKK